MKKLPLKHKIYNACYTPKYQYQQCKREKLTEPSKFIADYKQIFSSCLACKEKLCMSFSENESPVNFSYHKEVCPSSAISFNYEKNIVEISKNCTKCLLCVLRCPYGAIYIDLINNFPKVAIRDEKEFLLTSEKEFQKYFERITFIKDFSSAEKDNLLHLIHEHQVLSTEKIFYPFISKILTNIGFTTITTRTGDTNDRTDSRIYGDFGIIPIEIKSPTECLVIPTKAVRQALENKIIVLAREVRYPTEKNITSLIIGFEKPNLRSDVYETIFDIHKTYDINIGLLSLDDLIKMLWKIYIHEELKKEKIIYLRGNIDEKTVQGK